MWMDILKTPITIGRTRIGMKPMPEDKDCCEEIREMWKKYLSKVRDTLDKLKEYNGNHLIEEHGIEEELPFTDRVEMYEAYRVLLDAYDRLNCDELWHNIADELDDNERWWFNQDDLEWNNVFNWVEPMRKVLSKKLKECESEMREGI